MNSGYLSLFSYSRCNHNRNIYIEREGKLNLDFYKIIFNSAKIEERKKNEKMKNIKIATTNHRPTSN